MCVFSSCEASHQVSGKLTEADQPNHPTLQKIVIWISPEPLVPKSWNFARSCIQLKSIECELYTAFSLFMMAKVAVKTFGPKNIGAMCRHNNKTECRIQLTFNRLKLDATSCKILALWDKGFRRYPNYNFLQGRVVGLVCLIQFAWNLVWSFTWTKDTHVQKINWLAQAV